MENELVLFYIAIQSKTIVQISISSSIINNNNNNI